MKRNSTITGLVCLIMTVLGSNVAHGQSKGVIVSWGLQVVLEPSAYQGLEAIAAGYHHNLGLKPDGSVAAWGTNFSDDFVTPGPNDDFTAIAACWELCMGLDSDGTIVVWGTDNSFGQADVPEPNAGFTAIDAGWGYGLALRPDNTIAAWGWNEYGVCDIPEPNADFVDIAAGTYNCLGLKSDGSIVVWGSSYDGQDNIPYPNDDFVDIAASEVHCLGLKTDGSIVAWGEPNHGQCEVPAPNTDFVAVAARGRHSLGLKSDGTIVAWGNNQWGQSDVPEPNADFVAIAAGEKHSLGLKSDGTPVAWGFDIAGQAYIPDPDTDFVAVASSANHSLGLGYDGSITAWGTNYDGQCDVPEPNTGFAGVSAAGNYSLGLRSDGSIVAWGTWGGGQGDIPAPNADFVGIAAGVAHVLGLKSDGSIVAWGMDVFGQCDVPEPNAGFTSMAVGQFHSLGLKSDGTVVAWGLDSHGQCDVPEPNSGFVAVAGYDNHSLGLRSDGTIAAWGNNEEGQCNVSEPNADFTAISTTGDYGMGLKSDGTIVAWGDSLAGSLVQRTPPEPDTDIVAIAGGSQYGLILKRPTSAPPFFFPTHAMLPDMAEGATAWGDHDGDGDLDLLLSGWTGEARVTDVFANDGGVFADLAAGLPPLRDSAVAWGDYDNDGDLDILMAGVNAGEARVSYVFRNDEGAHVDIGTGLLGVSDGGAAWGDCDNDGDLDILLTGRDDTDLRTARIYRNDASGFVDIAAGLVGVADGSASWGDHDGDGDLDILYTGADEAGLKRAFVYENDGGTFSDAGASLSGTALGDAAWGDYDNDGDLDIVLTGRNGSDVPICGIYRNDGGAYVDMAAGLTGVYHGLADWGDCDNDGDLDLLVSGCDQSGIERATVYLNDGGTFSGLDAPLVGTERCAGGWADIDNDGDLDILLAGVDLSDDAHTILYRSSLSAVNTPPGVPGKLRAAVAGSSVTFSWAPAADAETPAAALTYNLRVGLSPGGAHVMPAMSDSTTGYAHLVRRGNVDHNLSWTIDIPAAAQGDLIYWSVQAVDGAWATSPFSGIQGINVISDIHDVPASSGLELRPGTPNPFNPRTTLRFALPADAARVRLDVYDVQGRRVRILHDGALAAGEHTVVWNGMDDRGRDLPSGVYVCRLTDGRHRASMRTTLLR